MCLMLTRIYFLDLRPALAALPCGRSLGESGVSPGVGCALSPPHGYDGHMDDPAYAGAHCQNETLQVVWFSSTRPGWYPGLRHVWGNPSDSEHRDPHAGLPAVVVRPYCSDGCVLYLFFERSGTGLRRP